MQREAPTPPGDGAVMWCASALLAAPTISAMMVAPRAIAKSMRSSTKTAAPSPMMKPSRVASNGLLTNVLDNAVMLLNPARAVMVAALSAPPVNTASQRPHAMSRAALPIACVAAAQAVQIVSAGP